MRSDERVVWKFIRRDGSSQMCVVPRALSYSEALRVGLNNLPADAPPGLREMLVTNVAQGPTK